ncbi:2'-5' RNA ligase [Pseudomonas sp. HMWF032]|uniref:2'-5' RNA ligase family protein n=1 Tax=Pseudomonas sp. HMWF032 TaxID=2056866 RepID=UPI000D33A441|nr:2'-5' RNA ligase family protein [Pseudomonas sp. HMWF032]PTS85733.1 2'-5' RNA ligase [Pseudomonas sp. HMWF032]PTT85087.1 2'-5' RNA ligase [Pseudomonas sp. HMWF010]
MLISNPLTGPTHSLITEQRDYPEWHLGRSRYAAWVLPVQCPHLLAHIACLQHAFSDWLHPPGRRQAHITVFVCGFISGQARHNDDVSKRQRQQQFKAIGRASRQPLTLEIGQPDSFASAAFLPVSDPSGQLQHWRTLLSEHSQEVRQSPYHAHITLGLYRQRVDAPLIRARLIELAEEHPRKLPVNSLQYVHYRARQLFSPLCVRQSFSLGT